jgi:hypothetical protein
MSIPLHRLYHFIENVACETYGDAVVIYRFWPNGSKNIQDLVPMPTFWHSWADSQIHPAVWCHDQEPLAYEWFSKNLRIPKNKKSTDVLKSLNLFVEPNNLNWLKNVFKKGIILHSEKRSQNVENYLANDQLLPVYYWSHAVIARDWFRYAVHENFKKNINRCFLIYNRAWTGTREYRLKFTDLLVKHALVDSCHTWFNPVDGDHDYKNHVFANQEWRPDHVLEQYFPPTDATSCASADFYTKDYQSTEIEVVLETLFDDERLHLTEKSLRPIACRQPFILMATHGSLQYLRDYGFQTFDSVWDESYDQIQDPVMRMQAIVDVMRDISGWSNEEWMSNKLRLDQIAEHNQKHFFSDAFSDQIIMELRTSMLHAFAQIQADPGFDTWISRWQQRLQHDEIQKFMDQPHEDPLLPNRRDYERVLKFIADNSDSVENYDKK